MFVSITGAWSTQPITFEMFEVHLQHCVMQGYPHSVSGGKVP